MSFLNDEQLKYLNGIGLQGTKSSKKIRQGTSELENLLRNDPIAADMYSYGAGGALQQGANSETAGNGFLGWLKDSADAGAASVVGGTARTLGEFMPFGQEAFNSAADYMDEVARRNSPTEELTGMNYVASAIGNALGSGGATMAETAALIGAGKLLGLGGLASGALGLASKTPGLGTLINAGKTMWQSPYGKYLVANVAGSPLEAVAESGNLITDMRNENAQAGYSKYSDEEIRNAALRSAGLNTAWLTAANMLEAGALGKITGALAGNVGERTAKQIARQAILGGGSSAISEGGEEYFQNLIGDYSKRGNIKDLNYDEALEAAKMGAIGGGVLGGLGAGGSAFFAKSNKPKGDIAEEVTSEGETQNTEENFWDNKDNARKAIKDAYSNGMLSKDDARNLLIKLDNGEIGPEAEKVQKERAKQTEQLLEKQRLQGYDDELDQYTDSKSVVEETAPSPAPEPVIQGLTQQQGPQLFDNTLSNVFAQADKDKENAAREAFRQAILGTPTGKGVMPEIINPITGDAFSQPFSLGTITKATQNKALGATPSAYTSRKAMATGNAANQAINFPAQAGLNQSNMPIGSAQNLRQQVNAANLALAANRGATDKTAFQQQPAQQPSDVNATADRLMAEQAITNLFDNARLLPPEYYANRAAQQQAQAELAERRKALANILGNVATQKWDETQQEYGNRRQQALQNIANIVNARAAGKWDKLEGANASKQQSVQGIANIVNALAAGRFDKAEADSKANVDAKERQKAAQAIANIVNARAAGMWDSKEAENQAKAEARQAIANIVNARAAQQWDNAEKGKQNEKTEQKREAAKNTQGTKAEEKQNAQADKNVKQPKEEKPVEQKPVEQKPKEEVPKAENDNKINLPEDVTEEKPVTNEQATKSEADNPNKVDSYQEEKKKLEVAIEKDMGKYPNTEFDKKKTGTLYKGKTWREVFKDISHNRDVYINVDYYVTDKILDEPRFKGYSLVAIDNKANYRNAIPRGFNDFVKDNFVPMNNNKNTLIYKGLADNQHVANNNEEDKSKPAEKTVNEIYKEGISKLQDTYGDFKANSKLDPTSVSREYTDNDGYTANILYNGTDDREAYNNTYNVSVQPIGSNNLDVVFSDHVKLENIESKLAQLKEYLQKTRNNNMGNAAESYKVEDEATSAKQAKTEVVDKEPKFKWNKGTSQSDPVRFGTITLPDGTKQHVSVRPNINGDVEGEYNTVTVSDSKNNIIYINTNVDDVNVNKEIDNFIKNAGNRKSVTELKYQKDYDLAGPIKVIPQNGGTLAASSFNGLMGNVVISMADGTKAFTNTHTLCLNFDEKKYSKLISKDTKLSALHSSSVDQIVRDTEDKVSKKKLIPHNLIPVIMPLGDVNITILRNNESVITVVADYVKYFVKEYGNNIKFYGNGQNNTILVTDANGKTLGVITPIRVKADLYGTLNKFIDDGCPYISKYGERYVDPEIAAENARIEKEIAEQDAKKPKLKVRELKSLVDKCLADLEDADAEDDVLVYLEEHLSFKEYTSFSENGVIKEDAVNRINPAELKEINNILEKFNRRDDHENQTSDEEKIGHTSKNTAASIIQAANNAKEKFKNSLDKWNIPNNEKDTYYKDYEEAIDTAAKLHIKLADVKNKSNISLNAQAHYWMEKALGIRNRAIKKYDNDNYVKGYQDLHAKDIDEWVKENSLPEETGFSYTDKWGRNWELQNIIDVDNSQVYYFSGVNGKLSAYYTEQELINELVDTELYNKRVAAENVRNAEEKRQQAEKEKQENEEKAKREDMQGFTDGMSPIQKAKVIDTMVYKGVASYQIDKGTVLKNITRKELMEYAVGHELEVNADTKGNRTIYSLRVESGRYPITKTEYDYYNYLVNKKNNDEQEPTTNKDNSQNKPQDEQSEEYKYYMNERGASIGAVPDGFTRIDENDKGGRYGAIYYAKPLSKSEVAAYELTPDKNNKKQESIQDFGAYVAGARKDYSSENTGGKAKTSPKKDDKKDVPEWQKPFSVVTDPIMGMSDKPYHISYNPRQGSKIPIIYRRLSAEGFATEQEAMNAIKAAVFMHNFSIPQRKLSDGSIEYSIEKKIGDHKWWPIKDGFKSREEVDQYVKQHIDEILATKTYYGEGDLATPLIKDWREARQGKAKDRLKGKNVTTEMFMNEFGFRGVQFGNWNNQQERQELMNATYEAMHDLADLLGVPPKIVSLNGELALAFGARGVGLSGARAHFEPTATIINLTKMKGAGALAHEWQHAVDQYLLIKGGIIKNERDGGGWLTSKNAMAKASELGYDFRRTDNLTPALKDSFMKLMDVIMYKEETFTKDTNLIDKRITNNKEALDDKLNKLRQYIANERKYGSKKAAATPKQLAKFDEAAQKVAQFEGKLEWDWKLQRYTCPELEALGAVVKEVTNRGFAKNNDTASNLSYYLSMLHKLRKEKADAGVNSVGIKRVPTDYKAANIHIDNGRATDYWSKPTEMLSRAFSSYLEDKLKEQGYTSDFLSYGSYNYMYLFGKPFPEGKERERINKAFDEFYKEVAKEVERNIKETGEIKFSIKADNNAYKVDAADNNARTYSEVLEETIDAFPNAKITYNDNGKIVAELPNGAKFAISIKDNIILNESQQKKANASHGTTNGVVQGLWKKLNSSGVGRLLEVSQQSQQGTAYHEALHAAMDLALNKKEKTALLKYYAEKAKQENRDTEETLADAYRDWKIARQQNKGTRFGKLWQKVKDLCTRLKSLFDEGAKVESIFLDIESGKVYERATEELNLFNLGQEGENTQYSVTPTNDIQYSIAYHGTAHKFNEFDTNRIGSGIGRQIYGWGFYFAEDEAVAQTYRQNLSRSEEDGQTLEVEIPDDDVLLDYDLPFSEQPPKVQAALRKAAAGYGRSDMTVDGILDNFRSNIYIVRDLIENKMFKKSYRNVFLYDNFGSDVMELAEAYLNKENIDDIKDSIFENINEQMQYAVEQEMVDDDSAAAEKLSKQLTDEVVKTVKSLIDEESSGSGKIKFSDNMYGDQIYQIIARTVGSDKDASLLLNKYGIQGITYHGGQDGKCYVLFDPKSIKILRQYMLANNDIIPTRSRAEVEAEIRTAFPNGTIEYTNGVPAVTLPNGVKFQYSIRENIIVNAREQKRANAAHGTSGGRIQGFWQKFSGNGVQRLLAVAQNSERGTAFHEAMHAAIDLALTEKEANALRKHYQNKAKEQNRNVDEVIADAYRDWVLARQQKRGTAFGKLWQKIKDFCVRIRSLFDNGAEVKRIMQDVESGRVYERGTNNGNIKKRVYFSKVEIQGQAGSGTTQIAGTRGMYVKALKWLRGKHQDAKTVLDYGAGLGLGTDDMRQNNPDLNIDSYEPNPERWQGKKPPNYTNNTQINKDYDLILNTNVLNVVEKPIRDLIVKDIASHLNMNGKALITTRGWKGDISTAKNFKPSDEYHGIWIDKGKNGLVFQKGFDGDELKNYIEELLGNDFVVEKTRPTFGKSSVTITRIKPKADTNNTQNAKASQGMPDSYKTLKGSPIKRSKYGVGKLIGGQIYLHKDYALDVIPKDVWEKALKVLADTNSDFKYNCVMYDAKTGNVRFDEAPDFDTAREPVVGNTLTVKPDGTTKAGYSKYIWHHKWIWVKNDYQGFDVNESKAWSQKWLGILTETADGNGIERWNAQLDRFGLEHDGENIQYSVAAPKSKIASAFTNTERKGTIQSVKDFFKEHWKSFYSDYVDKNDVLHAFDVLTNSGLTLYEQVQNLPSTTAGFLKAISEGTEKHIDAANKHLKNVKMKHRVTLAMALDTINKETMDKAHPDYLAQNGFDSWVNAFGAYLGAERLLEMNSIAKAQGEEYKLPNKLTEAELQQFVRNAPMQFRKAADIFYKVNDNMLSVMEDAGVFSHDLAQLLRTKYKKYCPLLRDFSDTAAADSFINGLTTGGRGIGNVSIPLKKISISGSERGVLNPLETVLKSYAVMLNRAERNKVGLMAVNSAKEAGMEDIIEEVPEIIGKNGEVVNAVADPKNCVFTVLMNGKKKAYKTTPELYGPIVGYNMPAAGLVFGVARTAAKMLRTGATMSPSFILRNVLRDTIFAGISSKNGFIPILDTWRGGVALWSDPAMRAEFEAAGVTEFNFYSSQEQRIKSIDAMAGEKPVGLWEMIKWVAQHLEAASDFFESSTRMGEFMKARQKRMSIEEAARAAREVTLDFSRSGRVGEQINQVVPFFNACVQGGDKMLRLFKEDFRGTCVKLFKYIVLPSLFLWYLNNDKDWYKDLDPDVKNNYWCLGKVGRIPKPQEVGVIFGSGIEALLDQANAKDPEAIKNLGKAVFSNLMPGIVPTLFLPLLEWQANYSYFKGRPLVSSKYQRLPDELQYNDYTSELSKSIGNNPLYKVSPMKVDNLVRGYTGTMGTLLWSLPDYATDKAKNQPARNWYEYTPFRDFTVTDANMSRPLNDFYGMLDVANRQHAGYGVKGKPTQAVQAIRKTGTMISNIRKDIDKITKSKLTAERKRQLIDQRKAKMNQLARQANERYGKYFD